MLINGDRDVKFDSFPGLVYGSSTSAVSHNWCRCYHQRQPLGQMFESVAVADAVVSLMSIGNIVDIWGIAITGIFSEQKKKGKVLKYMQ